MEVCRICGGAEVLKCFLGNKQLIELLEVCANIEVKEDDFLPKHVCEQCEFGLRFSYRLRKQSEETEKRLRQEVMQTQAISTTTDVQDLTNLDNGKQQAKLSAITTVDTTSTVTIQQNLNSDIEEAPTNILSNDFQLDADEQSAQERHVSTSTIEISDEQHMRGAKVEKSQHISERFRLELQQRGVEMRSVIDNLLNEPELTQKVIAEKRIRLDMDAENANDYTYEELDVNEDKADDDVIELIDDEPSMQQAPDGSDFNTSDYQAQDIIEEILLSDEDEQQTNCIDDTNLNNVVYEKFEVECEESIGVDDCQIYFTKEERDDFDCDEYKENESIIIQNDKLKLEDAESTLENEQHISNNTEGKALDARSSTSKNISIGRITGYTCPTCNLALTNQRTYREHIKIHGKERFRCSHCNKWFAKRHRFLVHEKTHQKDISHQCPLCERTYQLRCNLTRHINNVHKKKGYICAVCGESFGRSDVLKNHMSTHSDERDFQCDKCPERFKSQQYLSKHMRKHEKSKGESDDHTPKTDDDADNKDKGSTTKEKSHYCHYCGKISKHHFTHKMHMRIHTQERPHKCDACGKSFRTLAALITHERIHEDARPYQCEHCLLSFRQQGHLKEHRMIHEGIMPHVCSICNLSFTKKNNMLVHMRIHSGENPYKCVTCGEQFKKLMQLRKHEQTEHDKKIVEKANDTEKLLQDEIEEEAFDIEDDGEEETIEEAATITTIEEEGEFPNNHRESDTSFANLSTKLLCSDSNDIELIESESTIADNITSDDMVMQNGIRMMPGVVSSVGLEQSFSNALTQDFHIDNNDVVLVVDDNAKFNSLFIMDD